MHAASVSRSGGNAGSIAHELNDNAESLPTRLKNVIECSQKSREGSNDCQELEQHRSSSGRPSEGSEVRVYLYNSDKTKKRQRTNCNAGKH